MKNSIIALFIVILFVGCNSIKWVTEEKGTVYRIKENVVCVEYRLRNSCETASNCFYLENKHDYKIGDLYPKK